MTLIKKFAWYGSSVAFATVLALALLVTGPAKVAFATAVSAVTPAAPIQAAGLTETWTVTYTASGVTGITTGSVTFPTGFTVPSGTISGVSATGAGAACTNVAATGSGQVVSFTMTSCATAAAATNTFVVPGITNTGTTGTTGNFTVVTSADADGASGTAVIWNTTFTPTPSSATVAADSASTVSLAVAASHDAANGAGGGTVTITTSLGTFVSASDGGILAAAGTVSTDGKTISGSVQANTDTTANTVLIKSDTAGSAIVTVRVTPAGGGSAVVTGQTTVTFTTASALPGAVATISLGTPSPVSAPSGGGTHSAITITARDANGTTVAAGTTLTVTTSFGVVSSAAGTPRACDTATGGATAGSNQGCTVTLASGGTGTIHIYGNGAAGTATVTVVKGSVTGTQTVAISGAVDALAVAVTRANPGIGSAPAASSSANRLAITVTDSAGNKITGQTAALSVVEASSGITFQASNSTTVTVTSITDGTNDAPTQGGTATSDGIIYAYYTIPSTATAGSVFTLKATIGTKSGTVTITVAGAVSTVTVVSDPTNPTTAGVSTLTVTALDALGNPASDGSSLTVAVSAGAVANCNTTITAGKGTCTFVAPGTAQNVNATAVVTSGSTVKTGSTTISVGGAAAPTPTEGEGTFASAPAAAGVSIVVFNGGTVAQLAETAAGLDVVSVSATVDGAFVVYIVGAPAFVNAAFNAAFPDGLAAGTAVILKK